MPDFSLLPEGFWLPLAADEAASRLAELYREAIPGHLLYGVLLQALADACDNDDVLFQHLENPERFTVAHLTGCGGPEIDVHHPTIEFDGTWAEFVVDQQRLLDWLRAN